MLNSSDSELEFTTNTTKNSSKKPDNKCNKSPGAPGGTANSKKSKKKKNKKSLNVEANGPCDPPSVTTTTTNSGDGDDGGEGSQSGIGVLPVPVGPVDEKEVEDVKLGTSSSEEDEVGEEGEVSSSESSVEGAYGYGRLALGIDPYELQNYDGNSVPTNGSQYLLKVMQEKRRTPKVAVGNVRMTKPKEGVRLNVKYVDNFKEQETDDLPSLGCAFSKYNLSQEQRDNILKDFSLLRSKVERWRELLANGVTTLKTSCVKFPDKTNQVVWLRFCFGIVFEEFVKARQAVGLSQLPLGRILEDYATDLKKPYKYGSIIKTEDQGSADQNPLSPGSITTTNDVVASSPESEEPREGCQPLMSLMLILSQSQIEKLMLFQSDWIRRFGFANKCQGEWLYALLACIDKPVDPSTMGDIRNICKSLITIRRNFLNKLHETQSALRTESPCDDNIDRLSDDFKKELSFEEPDVTFQADDYVNALNLFICVIGGYFGQKDLVEKL